MGKQGWIGVDLDQTLAYYDRWRGHEHIGAPVPAMVERVKRWLQEGYEVRVFTARVSGPHAEAREVEIAVKRWCLEHVGAELPVTCTKDFDMLELWDDRAVTVEPNTGVMLGRSSRGLD